MGSRVVSLNVNAFFGDNPLDIHFPEGWEVLECRMAGHDAPALSDDELRRALQSPIGSPRLAELAKGAKEVCILFDDLPKPTPTYRIAPFVLEELHEGGVSDDRIRFLAAPGSHRPLTYPEQAAKLGREIVERYRVFNHNPYEHLVYCGRTGWGTPVLVNREFASCDLRLGIGSIFPHGKAGFGGGGKLVMPGVSGVDTIYHSHTYAVRNMGMARLDDNEFRLNIDESARIAGLHYKVDSVLNNRREVVGLFAGDLVAEHRAACELARKLYYTEPATDADVVVANSYPDEMQAGRSYWTFGASLRQGGDAVLLCHSWEGQNMLYVASRFGKSYGAQFWDPQARDRAFARADRVFLLAPFLSRVDREELAPPEKLVWCKAWDELVGQLAARHGAKAKVVVYPYAPLQQWVK